MELISAVPFQLQVTVVWKGGLKIEVGETSAMVILVEKKVASLAEAPRAQLVLSEKVELAPTVRVEVVGV